MGYFLFQNTTVLILLRIVQLGPVGECSTHSGSKVRLLAENGFISPSRVSHGVQRSIYYVHSLIAGEGLGPDLGVAKRNEQENKLPPPPTSVTDSWSVATAAT